MGMISFLVRSKIHSSTKRPERVVSERVGKGPVVALAVLVTSTPAASANPTIPSQKVMSRAIGRCVKREAGS